MDRAGWSCVFPFLYVCASLIVQLIKIHLKCRRPQFYSWVRRICWRRVKLLTPVFMGFPSGSAVKNLPAMWETWVQSLGWRREKLPTPVFWPGEFHGLYSPWGCKELDTIKWLSLYIAFSTNNNTFVEKWQDKGKQFQASKDSKL